MLSRSSPADHFGQPEMFCTSCVPAPKGQIGGVVFLQVRLKTRKGLPRVPHLRLGVPAEPDKIDEVIGKKTKPTQV